MLFLKSSNMMGLLSVNIKSSTYRHANNVLPSVSFFTYIVCSYEYFSNLFSSKNTYQFWYSKHIEFASNRRGLSSTCILCLHFQLQCIQVVVQHRSFLLESHSEMLTSQRVDKFSINDVQLVRSLV